MFACILWIPVCHPVEVFANMCTGYVHISTCVNVTGYVHTRILICTSFVHTFSAFTCPHAQVMPHERYEALQAERPAATSSVQL